MKMKLLEALKLTLLGIIALVLVGAPATRAQEAEEEDPVKAEVLLSQDRVRPGDSFLVAVVLHIAETYHIYGEGVENLIPLVLKPKEYSYLKFESVTLPEPMLKKDPVIEEELPIYEGTIVAVARATASEDLPGDSLMVEVDIDYQACTPEFCLPPVEGVGAATTVPVGKAGEAIELVNQKLFEKFAPPSVTISPEDVPKEEFEKALEQKGLVFAILLAFVAGLAASASPCVYPMIPITVSFFGSQVRSRSQTILLALLYVLGICVTYTILGVGTSLLGKELGAVLQSPWMLGAFVIFFVVLALSMFGLYEIRLPSGLASKLEGGGKQGALGAFFMGGVLGFIAAPCVGPFLGGILLYVAQTRDVAIGSVTLFAFGLAMGIPFLFLAIFSGAIASLPRAGAWLVKVKAFFGYIMLGVAVYFLNLIPSVPDILIGVLAGGLLIAGGIHLGALRKTKPAGLVPLLGRAVCVAALVVGAYVMADTFLGTQEVEGKTTWQHPETAKAFEGVLAAAKAEGKPVVVDFWAEWCVPCKQMDKNVLGTPEVERELERFVSVKMDCTLDDSEATKIRFDRFKAKSLPYFAFFDSKGQFLGKKAIKGKAGKAEFLEILKGIQ